MAVPTVTSILFDRVEISVDGGTLFLMVGSSHLNWTLMAIVEAKTAYFEDFTSIHGAMVAVDKAGTIHFSKTAEQTSADPHSLYRGHSLAEVLASDHDLLGRELLAGKGDPDYNEVASCLAPITQMQTYTWVGTSTSPDKVGIAYGGRTANFDPIAFIPEIANIRAERKVLDGLVGEYLQVARFVYPESDETWSELIIFAPEKPGQNPCLQPTWYRLSRIEQGSLVWTKYFDTYPTFDTDDPISNWTDFYSDLSQVKIKTDRILDTGMQVSIPDVRLQNQAKHSLIRSINTRINGFPKYGVMDRNYGGAEHDGFQDTFNADATVMLDWGQFDQARRIIDNYFTYFVQDDGSVLYRGPETGQYGRMLTVVANYYQLTKDAALLLRHQKRIDAICGLLLQKRRVAQTLPKESPVYGMISGWCEADSCLEPDPSRYLLPYFSNSAEAIRGFACLGSAWTDIGNELGLSDRSEQGYLLFKESVALKPSSFFIDFQLALARSTLQNTDPICIPAVAGAKEPFDIASQRDLLDPQFRAYRTYVEMMFSGLLTKDQLGTIVNYRETHRDILVGVPAVYGYNSGEMGGFLAYGHAYGLLQHEFIREYLLALYSLSAHQYTRGTWTAPETRRIDPELAAPYCVPAQLTVPLLLRWLLAFEEPVEDTLWLLRATPRNWLARGQTIQADRVPTRWGPVNYRIDSQLDRNRIFIRINLSQAPEILKIRLRIPDLDRPIHSVTLNGQPHADFDSETITIKAFPTSYLSIEATYH